MTTTIARSHRLAPTVATLNETHPTTCPIVQGVRLAYAAWFYDLSDGYILYYRPGCGQHYEHRLVAEFAFGDIPAGHVVRHCNDDRADNRAENLRILSRSDHGLAVFGHEPARTYTCATCGTEFKAVSQRINRSLSGDLYCSPACRQFAQRKVTRPSAEELRQLMVDVGNWTALGQLFGVSDNAVRKWAKRYGLDLALCDGRRKDTTASQRYPSP
jgi:DNA-directed RNA polymerase subunit RPC12/RpoP